MSDLTPLFDAAAQALVDAPPAHDLAHVRRVVHNVELLCAQTEADAAIAVPAAVLHELVNLPKNHPDSHRSGDLCAEAARALLRQLNWPEERAEAVARCIAEHAWSKGAAPTSLEAAVLQDADRLDAIGAIGVARCMAVCGELNRPLYSPEDPLAHQRELDDRRFGLDHFFKKLLRIDERLNTDAARALAAPRLQFLRQFVDQLASELGVEAQRA